MPRRGDHERVDEVDATENATAMRAERDGDDLVRGLGGDERHRPVAGAMGRRSRDEEQSDSDAEHESAHAPHTNEAYREVP